MIKKISGLFLVVILICGPVFADSKEDIYSKLKCCNCGEGFTPCNCQHSKEMKIYIETLMDEGFDEEKILTKIAKKFTLDAIIDVESKERIKAILIEEAGENRPEIFIESLSKDLGKISKSKNILEFKVVVVNKGKEILKIINLKTSCPCGKIKLKVKGYESPVFGTKGAESGWETRILPKEKGEIIIITDLNHESIRLGDFFRTAEIISNDPIDSSLTIIYRGEIVE
ncbi:MAG: DUF1573 domain-containing protein [Candidatus Omnitrophica bacterium]|nr:DUF1573 domain-containing protein [Candidatus Omnitrophota bacterium]